MEQQISFCTAEDGVRIAYATYGGAGAPLFVLPDIVGQEAIWRHPDGRGLLETIGVGRRLITYDARGTGSSDRIADFTGLEAYSRDLAAVAGALELPPVTMFPLHGISSAIALLYAHQRPGAVTSIILWGAMIVKPRVEGIHVETFARMWRWNARAMATLYFPSGPIEMQQWYSKHLGDAQYEKTVAQVANQEWDLTPILGSIHVPALILQRERVKTTDPRQALDAARLMPNARLVRLEGDEDHAIFNHAQYIDALMAFLDEHAPAGAIAPTTAVAGPDSAGARLTERETEVLSLLAGGRTGREIAEALNVSVSTAQRHIANIYAKIGARGRVDAAAYALARGLVTPRE
jgi:DNA-binding CsgD family transcriptional regulator/pimeloyl-ACP methyl ester carboxylesterase